jgi:hypothetical protein
VRTSRRQKERGQARKETKILKRGKSTSGELGEVQKIRWKIANITEGESIEGKTKRGQAKRKPTAEELGEVPSIQQGSEHQKGKEVAGK